MRVCACVSGLSECVRSIACVLQELRALAHILTHTHIHTHAHKRAGIHHTHTPTYTLQHTPSQTTPNSPFPSTLSLCTLMAFLPLPPSLSPFPALSSPGGSSIRCTAGSRPPMSAASPDSPAGVSRVLRTDSVMLSSELGTEIACARIGCSEPILVRICCPAGVVRMGSAPVESAKESSCLCTLL